MIPSIRQQWRKLANIEWPHYLTLMVLAGFTIATYIFFNINDLPSMILSKVIMAVFTKWPNDTATSRHLSLASLHDPLPLQD